MVEVVSGGGGTTTGITSVGRLGVENEVLLSEVVVGGGGGGGS